MNHSYRLGLGIVLVTVLASSLLAARVPPPLPASAARHLAGVYPPLGPFRFTERSGRAVTDADLAGDVWVASFIFTRCKASCPRISTAMKGLQDRLATTGVRLVSISVDPDRDTPAVLDRYARAFSADPDRWWFLTGPKTETYNLIREGFKLGVVPEDPGNPRFELMEIAHSERLALVDRGNRLVGLFTAEDPVELTALIEQARRLDLDWVTRLPAVNATLNGLGTLLLLAGFGAIRSGRQRVHIYLMSAALAVSVLFLVSYLLYHAMIGGGTPFRGVGPIRVAYFTVLISHVVLAAAVVPLVLLTVWRAARRQFDRHARIARVTYPIWLYVSITGVIVYLMLYQLTIPISHY